MEDLESFTKKCLEGPPKDTELVVIDEIGKMEMYSEKFVHEVNIRLKADIPVLAVLHRDLVGRYGIYGKVYRLGEDNFTKTKSRIEDEIKRF